MNLSPSSFEVIPVEDRSYDMKKGAERLPPGSLSTEAEGGDQGSVALDVLTTQVVEQPASLSDQHQKTTA